MSVRFVYLLLGLQLMPIELILSSILCKDSRIDSITYANDVKMYFFTSGGYYWWLEEKDFPPQDNAAKKLPSPFIMGHAAVYVDSDNGCASSRNEVFKKLNTFKEVWVEEYVGGQHKIMVFDTKLGVWKNGTVVYNSDHCVSRARIDWASGRALDAMLVRNHLEIYFVQGDSYSMVDCNYICSNPQDNWGDDKPVYKTTDLHSVDTIYGMLLKRNRVILLFNKNTYYELTIQSNSRNGRLVTTKDPKQLDIIRDFFKIESPSQCIEPTTQLVSNVVNEQTVNDQSDGATMAPVQGESSNTKPDEESDGKGFKIVIICIILLVIVVIVSVISFFVIKSKSGKGSESKEKADTTKPKPSTTGAKGSAPSKVDSKSSMVTNKSNMGVVGIASKSNLPKTSKK